MYKKVNGYAPCEIENNVTKFWKENKVFESSVEARSGADEFSFYDGPPTANGKPHVGHVLTRTMKDIIPRYHTMKGEHVLRKAGWDTHGLPVELEVEKSLSLDGKKDIEKYGVQPFIEKCKQSVWKYKGEWERMSDRVGYWADMDNPYVTYDDKYIESVWWSLKTIFDRGLIYKGHKIVPYCPRCGTALSSHEVAQGYKDVTEKTAVVAFKSCLKDVGECYILAWTTTPWTLPSNVALCVNKSFTYSLINVDGKKYILAKELIEKHFDKYEIIKDYKGKDLVGTEYEPLYRTYDGDKHAYRVVADNYVTLGEGTGVVHIAPAFGEDDARVGRDYDLPFVQCVDERGLLTAPKAFCGKFCKDADKDIIVDLKTRGLLIAAPSYTHSYPFCWRCNTPLLYYARSSWFIKTTAVKDALIRNNASVNWYPQSIGTGRMGNFLENVIDWGLSRDRYWGTPLPIWVCDKCGKTEAIGSKQELKDKCGIKGDIELHKPYVDEATYKCSCGGTMKRTPEVIDCWYDSGSMPFAQYHYPFENKDVFEKTFPADFISEAVDQTRGWFYTLLVISTLLFDKAPFKNCLVLGHVTDEQGRKQSKHLGNVVDPNAVFDRTGADAVRWYFYTNSAPYLPSRFYEKAVVESQNKYLGTLFNTYAFYIMYAEIDKFNPTKVDKSKVKYTLMDRWLLSELGALVNFVIENLDNYKIYEAAKAIGDFTDKLSNWYVRRSRERFWAGGMGDDKTAAFTTLYTVLDNLSRLTAPFTPFIAEEIYQNVVKSVDKSAPISVHTADFPKSTDFAVDPKLIEDMERVIKAAELGRAARNKSGIKNRQTLQKVVVAGAFPEEYSDILKDELNVKDVTSGGENEFASYDVKPQLKTVGPKYGKLVGAIRNHLAANGDVAATTALGGQIYVFEVDGVKVELTKDDMLISTKGAEGYCVETDGDMTVALDTQLNDELIKEGCCRELISKIQTQRKALGFEVTDRINIYYQGDKFIDEVFGVFGERIKKVTLAKEVDRLENHKVFGKSAIAADINGYDVLLAVVKC
ncbi:MAG: isoleucine--tRNA ligase [Clostridiales bacterium]|nr:isoleucine--tRNA ligase [Clostridiales bacterium]